MAAGSKTENRALEKIPADMHPHGQPQHTCGEIAVNSKEAKKHYDGRGKQTCIGIHKVYCPIDPAGKENCRQLTHTIGHVLKQVPSEHEFLRDGKGGDEQSEKGDGHEGTYGGGVGVELSKRHEDVASWPLRASKVDDG